MKAPWIGTAFACCPDKNLTSFKGMEPLGELDFSFS